MAVNSELPVGEVGLTHDKSRPSKRKLQGTCAVDAGAPAGDGVGCRGSAGAGGDGGDGKDGGSGRGDNDGPGRDDKDRGVMGADLDASASGDGGARRACGAGRAVGADGDGAGEGEAVGGALACGVKSHFSLRRSVVVRIKKALPVVSSGQPRVLGI